MEEKSIYSSYRWAMLLTTSLAILTIYMDMVAIAPILGDVAKSLKIEMGSATNLMMVFVLATACVLIWGGVVCDKYGVTAALVLGLLCATVPATLMPWIGTSYGAVIVARVIQGASVGFIFAVLGPIMALWFPPKEQGIAGGVMLAFISVGSAIGGLVSPLIASSGISWQGTVSIMSILGWVAIVLALVVTRRPPNPEILKGLMEVMQSSAGSLSLGQAFKLPMTWIGAFMVFFNTWVLYCFLNLIPPYIAAPSPMGVGLGPVTAGQLSLAGTVIGIIATLLGGTFFDKVAKGKIKPAVIIGFVLSILFAFPMAMPGIYSNMPIFILCLMLVGWGLNFMSASVSAFIAMNYPPNMVGRMVGWWFGFGTFGGALGLYVGGQTIAATGSFKTSIVMLSVAAFVGLIFCFILRPAHKK